MPKWPENNHLVEVNENKRDFKISSAQDPDRGLNGSLWYWVENSPNQDLKFAQNKTT